MIDEKYTIEILQKLVRINSVNPSLEADGPGEQEIAEFIHDELSKLGIFSEIDVLAPNRANVTAVFKGSGGGRSLMINAHTDTVGVAGMTDPFSGDVVDGKLYGRGSYDMKGSIAAMMGVAESLIRHPEILKGDLILSFVADEEYESIGAQAFVEKYKPQAAIVTEPTDLGVCIAHRGFAVFKITTKGKTAHGGNHKQGVDANARMGLFLKKIYELSDRLPDEKSHPLCGEASVHVPLMEGGRSLFIYAHESTIHLERRLIPGETLEQIYTELNDLIQEVKNEEPTFKADVELIIWRSPYEVSEEALIVRHLKQAARKTSGYDHKVMGHSWWEDSAIFGDAGIETVIIGPAGAGIHEDVECVDISSIAKLALILRSTVLSYCNDLEI